MQLSAKLKKIQCMGFRAIFLGVILLAMNKPRPSIEMTVDQLAEAKEASQIWKYSYERTSESWREVKPTAVG